MEDNFINNFFSKIKNKFNNKKDYPRFNDYSFSGEELDNLSRKNMEEINKLRRGDSNKDVENSDSEFIDADNEKEELNDDIDVNLDEVNKSDIESIGNDSYEGYINLSLERRENIMKRWNSIDVVRLSNDIDEGKDILEHNYTITYPDMALRYIYRIRDEYDILIEYLIGFNNEKKGVLEKNIFSSKLDDEWKYLNSYIKILEKIKSAVNK